VRLSKLQKKILLVLYENKGSVVGAVNLTRLVYDEKRASNGAYVMYVMNTVRSLEKLGLVKVSRLEEKRDIPGRRPYVISITVDGIDELIRRALGVKEPKSLEGGAR